MSHTQKPLLMSYSLEPMQISYSRGSQHMTFSRRLLPTSHGLGAHHISKSQSRVIAMRQFRIPV